MRPITNNIFTLVIYIFFQMTIGCYIIDAQHCSTPAITDNTNVSNLASGNDYTLQLYFHVINNAWDDPKDVELGFNELNKKFSPKGIDFIWDCHINYITESYEATPAIFEIENHTDGIDIYLFAPNASSGENDGRANGVGISSELFVLADPKEEFELGGRVFIPILNHEMGHVLNLWHTHHQFEEGGCEEFVDGSNCLECGDEICDTPSDPNILAQVDEACNWTGIILGGDGTDSNGDPYMPDTRNLMSYSSLECRKEITDDQTTRMLLAIANKPFLMNCQVNSNDLSIVGNELITNHRSVNGNIIIPDGSELIIKGSLSMKHGKRIIIESGGKLKLDKGSIFGACDERWEGIEIQDGGSLSVLNGEIIDALKPIVALENSTLNIETVNISFKNKTEQSQFPAIQIVGKIIASRTKDIHISNYKTGIQATEEAGYLNFERGSILRCQIGFDLIASPARISRYSIIGTNTGIRASFSPGMLIENNTIDIKTSVGGIGINSYWCDNSIIRANTIGEENRPATGMSIFVSNGTEIKDFNEVYANRNAIFIFGSDTDIIENDLNVVGAIDNTSQGVINIVLANGSNISQNYINGEGVTAGINTVNSTYNTISFNDIQSAYGGLQDRAAAIKSSGCSNQTISDNLVQGIGFTDGMLATNTTGNTYDCNISDAGASKNALNILYNSLGQSIRANTLTAGDQDLVIRSIIGEQSHEGNLFIGGNAFAESQSIAFASRFLVNANPPNDPNLKPINPNPSTGWFIDDPSVSKPYECENDPGPHWIPFWDDEDVLCSHYQRVINEYGYHSQEYALLVQTLIRYDIHRINFELPDCITGDPVLPDCWQVLLLAEYDLIKSDEHKANDRDQLSQGLTALSNAYKDSDGDQYFDVNQSSLAGMSQAIGDTRADMMTKVSTIKSDIYNIVCSDIVMDASLEIMKEYIRYLEWDGDASFDYSALVNYSQYCADDYGSFIHLARSLANTITDEYFDQYDGCHNGALESRSSNNDRTKLNVFPNPSSDLVNINFGTPVSGTLFVYDILGKEIIKLSIFEQEKVKLNLSDHRGMHMMRMEYDDGEVEITKHLSIQ